METFNFIVESSLRGSHNWDDPQQSSFHGHITVKTPDERLVATTLFDGLKVKFKVKVLGIEVLGLTGDNANQPTEINISGLLLLDDFSRESLKVLVTHNRKLFAWEAIVSDDTGFALLLEEDAFPNAHALAHKLKSLLNALAELFSNMLISTSQVIRPA